ncbi:MAG TPA: hypothetical protein VF111_02040 [Thermoanaerobaculia bacterium]
MKIICRSMSVHSGAQAGSATAAPDSFFAFAIRFRHAASLHVAGRDGGGLYIALKRKQAEAVVPLGGGHPARFPTGILPGGCPLSIMAP